MVVGGVAMSGPARDCQSSQLTLSVKTRRERERELSGNNNGGHLVLIRILIDYKLGIDIFRERKTTTK